MIVEKEWTNKILFLSTVKGTKSLSCLSFMFLSPYDETKSKKFDSSFWLSGKSTETNLDTITKEWNGDSSLTFLSLAIKLNEKQNKLQP